MLAFYQGVFGLRLNRTGRDRLDNLQFVELAFTESFDEAGNVVLVLKNDPAAVEVSSASAGLYHFAILVPNRKSLAQAYSGIERNHIHFDGFADHLVSESLYLHDPENNGIEIYRDRPRNEWSHDSEGLVVMDTLPLDLDSILAEMPREKEMEQQVFPSGARIGHIHLKVTDLDRSLEFYREKLGLDVSADLSSIGAVFLSAGGYHHHVGLNTWHSLGGESHKSGQAGLDSFAIALPYRDSLIRQIQSRLESYPMTKVEEWKILVVDPDGISITVRFYK